MKKYKYLVLILFFWHQAHTQPYNRNRAKYYLNYLDTCKVVSKKKDSTLLQIETGKYYFTIRKIDGFCFLECMTNDGRYKQLYMQDIRCSDKDSIAAKIIRLAGLSPVYTHN